jgi:hypothetical protein
MTLSTPRMTSRKVRVARANRPSALRNASMVDDVTTDKLLLLMVAMGAMTSAVRRSGTNRKSCRDVAYDRQAAQQSRRTGEAKGCGEAVISPQAPADHRKRHHDR